MISSRTPITTFIRLLGLCLFLAIANCQTSTTLVTATTTVTSSDNGGACNDFNGACVVYGGPGGAPYTTTVYAPSPSPTVVTATTTTTFTYIPAEQASTGASSACQNYNGACVVYGTNAQGSAQYTRTVYASTTRGSNGNGDGVIGGSNGDSQGYIGPSGAASLSTPVALSLACLLIVNLGFLLWM